MGVCQWVATMGLDGLQWFGLWGAGFGFFGFWLKGGGCQLGFGGSVGVGKQEGFGTIGVWRFGREDSGRMKCEGVKMSGWIGGDGLVNGRDRVTRQSIKGSFGSDTN
eukprot:TRINITY_DN10930_c0_g1_i7.p1 TRINITY_DN10930_c0_g1~~TRINITY_DN10930_c0_g1_i7.p1  ORF type:complete len:107 (-),score=22.43 TRINITY_DN10930_c0_g1_i7:67-387(-)